MEETVGPDGWVREGLMWRHGGGRRAHRGTERYEYALLCCRRCADVTKDLIRSELREGVHICKCVVVCGSIKISRYRLTACKKPHRVSSRSAVSNRRRYTDRSSIAPAYTHNSIHTQYTIHNTQYTIHTRQALRAHSSHSSHSSHRLVLPSLPLPSPPSSRQPLTVYGGQFNTNSVLLASP